MGTRNDAVVNTTTDLQFQFTRNGEKFQPFAFLRVEIYPTRTDAENQTNLIETINSISDNGNGLASYTAAAIATAGTYYDRIYITPKTGYPEWSEIDDAISSFYVQAEDFGGVPDGSPDRCLVSGYVIKPDGSVVSGATISIRLRETEGIGKYLSLLTLPDITTNENGFFSQYLIRSTTDERVVAEFNIVSGDYDETFAVIIPAVDTVDFTDLERV